MRWSSALATVAGMGCAAIVATGCAAEPAAEDSAASAGAASEASADEPLPRSEIPQLQAFKGWRDDTTLVEAPKPADARRVTLECADKHLYPTHPSADRKRYHRLATGHFDAFKVDGDSNVCKIKGPTKDPNTGLRRCALADTLQYVVLSDTLEDSCGNMYRGFWAVSFLTHDENMGTLMSLGRAVYQVPKSEFKGEMYDAQTYAVDESQLLFLSPLADGDTDAIAQARTRVTEAKTHRYDAATHLWEYIGPNR